MELIDYVAYVAIRQDAQDPDFANMLRAVGSVQQQQTIPDLARNVALNSEVWHCSCGYLGIWR